MGASPRGFCVSRIFSRAAKLANRGLVPYKGGVAIAGNGMSSMQRILNGGVAVLALVSAALAAVPAKAQEEFPFGFVMTLDAARMPGSKRIPSIDVGDNGEVILELWCDGGKGQFSVAGNTIVFVPGALENRTCTPDRAQADKDLLAALGDMTSWRRQGDQVTFIGSKQLRFVINSN